MKQLITLILVSMMAIAQLSCTSTFSDGEELSEEAEQMEASIDEQLDNLDDEEVELNQVKSSLNLKLLKKLL
jgi:hypothetical protein